MGHIFRGGGHFSGDQYVVDMGCIHCRGIVLLNDAAFADYIDFSWQQGLVRKGIADQKESSSLGIHLFQYMKKLLVIHVA